MAKKRRAAGEGSIFFSKSSGLWVAKITLPTGKEVRKRSKKQSVVKDWLLEQRKAISMGVPLTNERMTVGVYMDHYMETAKHSLRPKTIDSYEGMIRNHIKPEIGHLKLTALAPFHLEALYAKKLDTGLSRRTVQYIHAIIRRALNQAVKQGILVRNPTDAVTAPKPKKKTPTTFSVDEAKRFLKAIDNHRWRAIYYLAFAGLRRGEILGMSWEDVDFGRGTVSVRHTVYSIRGKVFIGEPKTAKGKRTVNVPPFIMEALKAHQRVTGDSRGLLFKTSSGRPISPRNLIRHFKNVLAKEGLPDVRFHDLRHTTATFLLKANVHPKVVQEMLGHSNISLTLTTYSHVTPGLMEKAAEELEDMLG